MIVKSELLPRFSAGIKIVLAIQVGSWSAT